MNQKGTEMSFYFYATNLLIHDIAFQWSAISDIVKENTHIDSKKRERIINLNNNFYSINLQSAFDCLLIAHNKEKEKKPKPFNLFMPPPKPLPKRVVLVDEVLSAMGADVPSDDDEYEAFLEKYYQDIEKEMKDYISKNKENLIDLNNTKSALVIQWLIFESLNYGQYIKKNDFLKNKRKKSRAAHDKKFNERGDNHRKPPFTPSEIRPEDIDEIVEDLFGGDTPPF